jgi:regulator of protease activity HflC (stomatin/prohibitin superfamily)
VPAAYIAIGAVVLLVLIALGKTIRIVPQARAGIVERLGRYNRTLHPGLTMLVPFVDKLRPLIDLREQVVSFPPQPVITEDNLVVGIDTVIYFQVTNAMAATYEIANYIQAVEQLTVTTLRNVVGGMDLERTLTSREDINSALRTVLDEATGKWGIRVNRVELKSIDPPMSIKDAMEKSMRADRDKRASILTAEGFKQSQILTAEGERQSSILRAEGAAQAAVLNAEADAKAAVLRAQGEAQAITSVFGAIHAGDPDPKLLAYQYLQTLPQIARGDSNKVWIVPSELGEALKGLGGIAAGFAAGAATTGGATGGPATSPPARTDGAVTGGVPPSAVVPNADTGVSAGALAGSEPARDSTAADPGTSNGAAPPSPSPQG